MAKLQEMLSLNGNSFVQAEQMAHRFITTQGPQFYLDLSLLQHAQGKIEESRRSIAEYSRHFPDCPRMHHARCWFALHDGNLQEGLNHVEWGRQVGTLGGGPEFKQMTKPQWDGKADLASTTVLLYGEGGQGDQIMCLRTAEWLRKRGAKVVAAVSEPLLGLANTSSGVSAAVVHAAAPHTACDYWIPAMSGPRLCNVAWETLWPGEYVFRRELPREVELWDRIVPWQKGVLNVGLRWSGLPTFEHEQFRRFPVELMFGLCDLPGCKFYSLQKGDPQAGLPENVADLEPLLGTWEHTASAIARMDLVITSCTSVAHVAAAMGRQTWVLPPLMCYWPWARPGDKSDWYPSVRLFRQREWDRWEQPFAEVRAALLKLNQ